MLRKLLLALCCIASLAAAHPHVFADASVTAVFDGTGFVGIQNRWIYDEVYSAALTASADENKDGKFSERESLTLKQQILGPLEGDNFYNYVQVQNRFLKAESVSNFKASLKGRKLVIEFLVKMTVPATDDYTMLVLVVSDPTNFIQMTTDMENAEVKAPDGMDVEYFSDSLEGLSLFRAFRSEIQGLYLRYKK